MDPHKEEQKFTALFPTPLAADKFAHITIAYLDNLNSQQLQDAKSALATIPLPALFWCTQKETFSTARGPVNVRKCRLLDHGINQEVESVYRRFAKRDPFMAADKPMPEVPTFHITVKNEAVERELAQNPLVEVTKAAIKPLGPHDPVFLTSGKTHEEYCWNEFHRDDDRSGLKAQANRLDIPGMSQQTVLHYVMQYCLKSHFSSSIKTSSK